jgi:outer membrane lipoprotein SlyB
LAQLTLELTRLHTADGQNIPIRTTQFVKQGPQSKKEDAEKIGAGAVIGTIIGAIAGGGKGAAIGAGAGGAAGAGTVAATRGKPAVLPVETRVSFRIDQAVEITERRRD